MALPARSAWLDAETDEIAHFKREVFIHSRRIVRYADPRRPLRRSGRQAKPFRGPGTSMFSKTRLDALSDGIFGVAMTLLVLDVRLPSDFQPRDSAELLHGIGDLWPKFLPYLLSFGVLGLRWLANIEVRSRAQFVNREYVSWLLLYLLLITCVPLTTIVVGRFAHLPPAIWLYAGNTLLIAAVGLRLIFITPDLEVGEHLRRRQMSSTVLIASSLLAIALSFIDSRVALWALALNFAVPLVIRWSGPAAMLD
jgi:uncharacterized membrane protein